MGNVLGFPRTGLTVINGGNWKPQMTGDWEADTLAGRQMAAALIDDMATTGNPLLLSTAARQIVAGGVYGGIEVGFFTALGERLVKQ